MPPRSRWSSAPAASSGRALSEATAIRRHVEFAERADLDLSRPRSRTARRWRDYGTVVNAAAYTAVDAAETADGRRAAWAANVTGVAASLESPPRTPSRWCTSPPTTCSTASERPYREDEPLSPLGVYGQTKAAGDQVATVPRHYIVRTSWVIGEGRTSCGPWPLSPTAVSIRRSSTTSSDA